jgi:hypothetical protein
MQNPPNYLDLVENIRLLNLFQQKALEKALCTIETTTQAKGIPLKFNDTPESEGRKDERAIQPSQTNNLTWLFHSTPQLV